MLSTDKIELLYSDFQKIKCMNSDLQAKNRMITALLIQNPFCWRVTGITKSALHELKTNEWKRDGLKLNRSHIFDRMETHKIMLEKEMKINEWWNFYWDRDSTIISKSSENKGISRFLPIPIDFQLGLFRNSGFRWRHSRAEMDFLRSLWDEHGMENELG